MRPSQGEVWDAKLDPTRGREQRGRRPVLVVSTDRFNHGPADLVIVVPLTRTDRGIALHVPIRPPEASLRAASFAMTEQIRSVSVDRLVKRRGPVTAATLRDVLARLRLLLR